MNHSIVQQYTDFHDSAALSPDDIPTTILSRTEEEKAVEMKPAKRTRKSRQADFNPDWHDAKEIVVPFDESSFSGLLVDEKTFQAAYSANRTPARLENPRLETERTIGHVVFTTDWWDDLMCFCSAFMVFVEILFLVWTAGLLLSGFPISKWLAWILVSVWPLTLLMFKFVMVKPVSYRLFLWCGTCVTTVSWLMWSPWSHEFTARFSAYFFRM